MRWLPAHRARPTPAASTGSARPAPSSARSRNVAWIAKPLPMSARTSSAVPKNESVMSPDPLVRSASASAALSATNCSMSRPTEP